MLDIDDISWRKKIYFSIVGLTKVVFKPESMLKIFMDIFSMVLILYEMLLVPLILSFDLTVSKGLNNFSTFISIYFMIDVAMNFNTAYYHKGNLIFDRKKIILNYLKLWFWLDLLSTFPYDWVIAAMDTNNPSI